MSDAPLVTRRIDDEVFARSQCFRRFGVRFHCAHGCFRCEECACVCRRGWGGGVLSRATASVRVSPTSVLAKSVLSAAGSMVQCVHKLIDPRCDVDVFGIVVCELSAQPQSVHACALLFSSLVRWPCSTRENRTHSLTRPHCTALYIPVPSAPTHHLCACTRA